MKLVKTLLFYLDLKKYHTSSTQFGFIIAIGNANSIRAKQMYNEIQINSRILQLIQTSGN